MLPQNIRLTNQPTLDLHAFLSDKKYSKIVVLVDENTKRHCYPLFQWPVHECIEVRSGEEQKNLTTCSIIWQSMTDLKLDRHACLIVLGGGVLGDMGGFCAATYKRGIDFILIPTTLLAQVDASLGGKLGIDFNHLKNHIGVFQEPILTLIYTGFLKSLPKAELRSGFAEVIKHCIISDKAMWETIRQKNLENQEWNELVEHSIAFKASVTRADPKEKGLRKILNAGHTIGHALESHLLSKEKKVLHGEAIAAGLVCEGYIARERKLMTSAEFEQVTEYILKIFGKINLPERETEEAAALTLQDKKNKDNSILCVLPEGIGRSRWDIAISLEEVKKALSFYQSIQI
jgi:3-dehydroquinate synthase